MSNILIIGGRFDLDVGANSICINNIANVLTKQGHHLWMITNSYEKDDYREQSNMKIYGLKGFLYKTRIAPLEKKGLFGKILFKTMTFFRHLLLVPFFPNVSYLRFRRILALSKKLLLDNKIDKVVCFYMPFEAIFCGVWLKQLFGNHIKVINCHLDLLQGRKNDSFVSIMPKYFCYKIEKFLKKEKNIVDAIILPELEHDNHKSDKYKYAGFPVCVEHGNSHLDKYDAKFEKSVINIVYVGSLDFFNRNPKIILDFIDKYNKENERKIVLHIWGIIDLKVQNILANYKNVFYKGFLKNEYSVDVLKQSDFVLNIGNAKQFNMVPSKIFKAFLSGKPIVNIVKNNKDVTLKYFEEYGHALNIFENMSMECEYHHFSNFIHENDGLTFEVSSTLIEHNTPEYYVSQIKNALE